MNQTIDKLTINAFANDLEAQFELAQRYAVGNEVRQDYVEAVKWYRRAADQDFADAQFELARCYETGNGVWRDYAEAAKWYRLAAEQGHAEAQRELGRCYTQGRGVKADYDEADKWFSTAADQGCFATESDFVELNALLQKSYKDGTLKYRGLEQLEKQYAAKKTTPRHPRKKYTGPFAGLVNPLIELWDMIMPEEANIFEWIVLLIFYIVVATVILVVATIFFVFQIFQILFLVEGIRGLAHGHRSR